MARPRVRLAPIALALALAACDSVRPDDPGDPMSNPIDTPTSCPTAHLVIALRGSSGGSTLARRSAADLSACRGQALEGQVHGVGGLPDGSELVGIDDRAVRLAVGGGEVWSHDAPSYGLEASSFATLAFERYMVAVLWTDSYGRGEQVEILDAETGAAVHRYEDVPGSPVALSQGIAGVGDRLALLDEYEDLHEAQVVLGAPALGGATELSVQMPRAGGSLESISAIPGRVAIGSKLGVIWWSSALPPAALGPVACAWPSRSGAAVPTDCSDFVAAVPVPGDDPRFVASCSTSMSGSSRDVVVELDRRGGCRLLIGPNALESDPSVTGMAWTGL